MTRSTGATVAVFVLSITLSLMPFATVNAHGDIKEWTVLVFLNGDNNLEYYAIDDFNEMERVGSDAAANVTAAVDNTVYANYTRP